MGNLAPISRSGYRLPTMLIARRMLRAWTATRKRAAPLRTSMETFTILPAHLLPPSARNVAVDLPIVRVLMPRAFVRRALRAGIAPLPTAAAPPLPRARPGRPGARTRGT
jgi:hypothetical protein